MGKLQEVERRRSPHTRLCSSLGSEEDYAAIEKAVGRVIGSWWTQGAFDVVVVAEYPNCETASVVALPVGMSGDVRSETMRAYTAEQMQRIIEKLR